MSPRRIRVDRLWLGVVLGAVVVGGVVLAGPGPAEHADHAGHADHAAHADERALYTCPMHPEVVSETPGRCPKCGMTLVLRAPSSGPSTTSSSSASPSPATSPATSPEKAPEKASEKATDTATLYTCPMHPEIESETPGRCPKCGMDLVPKAPSSALHTHVSPSTTPTPTSSSTSTPLKTVTAHQPEPGDDEVAYYTCPMHPSVKQHEPGSCPICGMDLTPVTRGAQRTGTVHVDALRRQTFGIRTAPVVQAPLSRTVRGQGTVVVDERRIVDISIQTHGWVEGLQVKETGQYVKQGATLTWLYSPPVVAAEEELLLALRTQKTMAGGAGGAGGAEGAVRRNDALVQGARGKLRSLGLQEWQIDALSTADVAPRRFAIVAPTAGYVVQKDVVEGAHVNDGARLFRLVSLDEVWVDAAIWARDLDALEVGQTVQVQTGRGSAPVEGRIDWIYPDVDARTQTGRVRLVMKNNAHNGLTLRPGMYVDVEVEIPLGTTLQVPADAVVQSGARAIVFVASAADDGAADGVYVPTEVTVGTRAGDVVSITAGLAAGQQVVAAGAFLIAAESRLTSSSSLWAPVAADGSTHAH